MGTASIHLLNSNLQTIYYVCIATSLGGLLFSRHLEEDEFEPSPHPNPKLNTDVSSKLPPIFYIGLITGVCSILVDNYELPYILMQGYSENIYALIVLLSSFFYIGTSAALAANKFKIADNYQFGIFGAGLTMGGYLLFMHVSNFILIVISMGIIAIGYTLYTTLINVYIAETYQQQAEVYFVKYGRMENYALALVFIFSLFKIEKLGIEKYYLVLSVLIGTYICVIMSIYVRHQKSHNTKKVSK